MAEEARAGCDSGGGSRTSSARQPGPAPGPRPLDRAGSHHRQPAALAQDV
jgi:hypothetical protein